MTTDQEEAARAYPYKTFTFRKTIFIKKDSKKGIDKLRQAFIKGAEWGRLEERKAPHPKVAPPDTNQ